jgi:hypothetical protein
MIEEPSPATPLRNAVDDFMHHQVTGTRQAMTALQRLVNAAASGADEIERLHVEIDSPKEDVRFASTDEAHRWASRVDGLTAKLREVDARYMALLKSVADGVAMQPRTVVLDLGHNAEVRR